MKSVSLLLVVLLAALQLSAAAADSDGKSWLEVELTKTPPGKSLIRVKDSHQNKSIPLRVVTVKL